MEMISYLNRASRISILSFLSVLLLMGLSLSSSAGSLGNGEVKDSNLGLDSTSESSQNPLIDNGDPFQFVIKIPSGRHKGRQVDLRHFRSVHSLTSEERERLNIPDSDGYVISNFKHQGQYWVAVVPKSAIEGTIFQMVEMKDLKPFDVPHSQIRFMLKKDPPVQLISQRTDRPRKETTLNEDIVFSLQVSKLEGSKRHTFVEGVLGNLANAYTFNSLTDVSSKDIRKGIPIRQYLLNFTARRSQRLFERALVHGEDAIRNPELYKTFTRNCDNQALCVVDEALDKPPAKKLSRVLQTFTMERQIKRRGIVVKQLPNLEVELGVDACTEDGMHRLAGEESVR